MIGRATTLEGCLGTLQASVNGKDSYGRTAFPRGSAVTVTLCLPRALGARSARLSLICDETGEERSVALLWQGMEEGRDLYSALLPKDFRRGLWFFRPEGEGSGGAFFGVRTEGKKMRFVQDGNAPRNFQFLFYEREHKPPEFILGKAIYHIFVDRYCRHGEPVLKGDAIFNEDWENGIPQFAPYPGAHLDNNMFFGGNLWGVVDKLDDIAALGVGCIYLSPIFRAYSNHKYDTGNYMEVDEAFGGEEALAALIEAAEKRGIRIVLDGVFNHTGDDSLYFNRRGNYPEVGAYQSEDSPYHGWYYFRHFPDKYDAWWDIPILPRLNTENPECREYFLGKDGVIAYWARKGIAGFRLDVVDELSDSFVRGIRERLAENASDSILYGEVWEDASNKIAYSTRRRYYWGGELDGVMNYPLRTGLIEYVRYGNIHPLRYALTEVLVNAPKAVADRQMNLLGTHDTDRILTALGGEGDAGKTNAELSVLRMSPKEREAAISRLKIAYLALATLPGVPCIYYGDEAGMEGYRDPFNRRPYPWSKREEELVSFYRSVGQLRLENKVYREGEFRLLQLDEELFAFLRTNGKKAAVTVACRAGEGVRIPLPKGARVPIGKVENGALVLSPLSAGVILCREEDELILEE